MNLHSQLFTFIDPESDQMYHFDATQMLRDATREYDRMYRDDKTIDHYSKLIESFDTPVDEELATHIFENNGVEQPHLDKLTLDEAKLTPIIGIDYDGTHTIIVDGNHRLLKLWFHNITTVHMLRFRRNAWQRYLITDLPKSSREFIRRDIKRSNDANAKPS